MNFTRIVEAVLFASDSPLTPGEIAGADEGLDEELVEAAITELRATYEADGRAFSVFEVAGGHQLLTKPEFAPYLDRFESVPKVVRLSAPALETLAIIAYRQPIGRIEIEYVRGVGVQGVLRSLVDRGLVEVVARGEGLGRPLLYGTTARFLEHFGFTSTDDLPKPDELPVVLAERVPLMEDRDAEQDGEPAEESSSVMPDSLGTSVINEGAA